MEHIFVRLRDANGGGGLEELGGGGVGPVLSVSLQVLPPPLPPQCTASSGMVDYALLQAVEASLEAALAFYSCSVLVS